MSIKYIYRSTNEQERVQNSAKAFEGFVNNSFKSMGVSHRVELANAVPATPHQVQYPDMTIAT